jgi:hypothetical protein
MASPLESALEEAREDNTLELVLAQEAVVATKELKLVVEHYTTLVQAVVHNTPVAADSKLVQVPHIQGAVLRKPEPPHKQGQGPVRCILEPELHKLVQESSATNTQERLLLGFVSWESKEE